MGAPKRPDHPTLGCECEVHATQRIRQRSYARTNIEAILERRRNQRRDDEKAFIASRGDRVTLEILIARGEVDVEQWYRCQGWAAQMGRQCLQKGTVIGKGGHWYCKRHVSK
jgi:hypothetical protein